MKRIILKENQVEHIRNFITEADKNEKLDNFIKNVISEFNGRMGNVKIGSGIIFGSGEVNVDDDSFNMEYLNFYGFLVTGVSKDKIELNYMKSDIPNAFSKGKDKLYFIDPKHTLVFNNGKPFVNIFSGGDDEPIVGNKIPKFVMFEVYDNILAIKDRSEEKFVTDLVKKSTDSNEKERKAALRKELGAKFTKEGDRFKEEALKKWEEGSKEIMQSMIFKPGMLGMDNFFFFPTGVVPMNNILKKYGLAVHPDEERSGFSSDGNGLKFQLTGQDLLDADGVTALGRNKASVGYDGHFNKDENSITYKKDDIEILFKLEGNHELNPGVIVDATATGFNKEAEIQKAKVKLKMV